MEVNLCLQSSHKADYYEMKAYMFIKGTANYLAKFQHYEYIETDSQIFPEYSLGCKGYIARNKYKFAL